MCPEDLNFTVYLREIIKFRINIKMDLSDIRSKCVDWIRLAQDKDWWRAVVNTVSNLQVP
jgi:hypothetical protein